MNKTTLFLGDLSTFCSERDIHMAFAPYGEILEIKIMKSEDSYRNLSYGFIKFADSLSAQKAMNGLNGVLFCGRNLRVGWASYKNKKEPRTYHHDRIHSSSVHVSYLSYQLKKLINEESLRILFSTYGVVLDVSIKKSYLDESINRQCGYGFVHFSANSEGLKNALAAVAALNDATIEDVCYKCSISHNLEKQLIEQQQVHLHSIEPERGVHDFSALPGDLSPPHQRKVFAAREDPVQFHNFDPSFRKEHVDPRFGAFEQPQPVFHGKRSLVQPDFQGRSSHHNSHNLHHFVQRSDQPIKHNGVGTGQQAFQNNRQSFSKPFFVPEDVKRTAQHAGPFPMSSVYGYGLDDMEACPDSFSQGSEMEAARPHWPNNQQHRMPGQDRPHQFHDLYMQKDLLLSSSLSRSSHSEKDDNLFNSLFGGVYSEACSSKSDASRLMSTSEKSSYSPFSSHGFYSGFN